MIIFRRSLLSVLDRNSSPPPQFSAHVYCDQKAGWIKMALGMEVGLVPGHIVQDGDPAPPKKESERPFLLWPNGWIDQDELDMQVGVRPGHIVLDGEPAPPPQSGRSPPSFRPISVVAK